MPHNRRVQTWREVGRDHPRGFVEELLRIPDDMGQVVKFKYRLAQKEFSDRKQLILRAGVPLRLAEIKWRRAGFSSTETAEMYVYCYSEDNARAGILAHEEHRSQKLLEQLGGYNKSLNEYHPHLEQRLSRDNVFGLKFEESTSQIMIGSAENPVKIRGDGLHAVLCSEFAHFLEKFRVVMREICPVVPAKAGSRIILESTGTYINSAPYEHYYSATPWDYFYNNGFTRKRGCNEFVRHFSSWLKDPECIKPFAEGQEELEFRKLVAEMDEYEPRLADKCREYKLRPEQWNWCWDMFMHKSGDQVFSYFVREFPFVEQDAWSAGGESYFDSELITLAKPEHPQHIYVLDEFNMCKLFSDMSDLRELPEDQSDELPDYTVRPVIKVWADPRPGAQYVLGSDSAQGEIGGDYSAGYVIDKRTREMVAAYHGLMRPDEAAHIIVSLCKIYHNALAAPESNAQGGGAECINMMQRLGYHRIYVFRRYDHVEGIKLTNYLGWCTMPRTRSLMLGEMRKLFQDSLRQRVSIANAFKDRACLNEMRSFGINERTGKPEALGGAHDDRVIALAIANQVASDETYCSRDDLVHKYHDLNVARVIDPTQQRLITKVSNPQKVIDGIFGKSGSLSRNKFDLL
jgi:hypothetical protein